MNKLIKHSAVTRAFCLIIACWFSSVHVTCQENLILNPSGEEAINIPNNLAQYDRAKYWWDCDIYTTDYYTSETSSTDLNYIPANAFGYQEAKDGNFYFGIFLLEYIYVTGTCLNCYIEYVAGRFKKPLEEGKIYKIEFWQNKADSLTLITNALSLVLTYDTVIDPENYQNYGYEIWTENSQFKEVNEWVKVSKTFKSLGGEKGFVVGRFKPYNEILINFEGNNHAKVEYDYRYLDNFSLIECPTCSPEEFPVDDQLSLISNSAMDGTPPSLEMWLIPNSTGSLRIYDSAGRLVAEEQYTALQNNYTFNNYAAGIYHYYFTTDLGYMEYGKVLVHE